MKHRFFFTLVFIGLLALLEGSSSFSVEAEKELEAGCGLLVKGKLPQVITFERSEKKPNGEEVAWLRLLNNTNCNIVIPVSSLKLTKFPGGKFTTDLQDGTSTEIYFEFEDSQAKAISLGAFGLGDEVIVSRLISGRSIFFAVPKSRIKQKQDVRVPFKYEWEGGPAPSSGSVKHYVYFHFQDFPNR